MKTKKKKRPPKLKNENDTPKGLQIDKDSMENQTNNKTTGIILRNWNFNRITIRQRKHGNKKVLYSVEWEKREAVPFRNPKARN